MRGSLLWVLAVVFGVGITCCKRVIGQQRCAELITAVPKLDADPRDPTWFHLYVQALSITQRTASEALLSRGETTDLSVEVGTAGDSLWQAVRRDSLQVANLASVLGSIISGANLKFADAHALVAATLYEKWALPPESALRILSDPLQRPRARTFAIRAIKGVWRSPAFADGSLAALCSLASSAAAIKSLAGNRAEQPLSRQLNADDLSMYMEIQAALANRDDSKEMIRRIEFLLPDGNPVRQTMITFLHHLD